ncbi:hypothetical protein [Ilumatobacter coccineus]|nr:hypothetical protein [Ilumatobacter coccineus]
MSNIPPPGGGENPMQPPPDPFAAPASPPSMPQPPTAPVGYQPYPVGGAHTMAQPAKSGKLLAGGIVAVVLAAFTILVGLVIALLGDAINDIASDFGNAVVLIGMVVAALGGFGLAAGIGAIMRRSWGRICSIVYGSINGVLAVLGLASEPDGSSVVYLAMSVAIVVLCALGPATRS